MKTTVKGLPARATLGQLQRYIEREAKKRGFGGQTALQKCLILGEEVGELFKAIRKEGKMPVGLHSKVGIVSEELADVLMYVCTILFAMCLLCAAPAGAQMFGVKPDYNNPALYLNPGPQSGISMAADALRAEIGVSTCANAEELVPAVYKWMAGGFSASAAGGALIGKTTADGLLKGRYLSGCHDWALLFSSVLRRLGYPALMADAAGIKWAREYAGNGDFSGHVLAEAYIEGRWMLIDATSGRYVRNYDPHNPVIPLRVGGENAGLYVMFKGLDPQSYGIAGNDELREKMRAFVLRLPGLDLKYPAYTVTYSQVPGPDVVQGAPGQAPVPRLSEQDVAGDCRQSPCRNHPCKGAVVQAGSWDLLAEKTGGAYFAHHYPRSHIFERPEVKALRFSTLKELNDYLGSLK